MILQRKICNHGVYIKGVTFFVFVQVEKKVEGIRSSVQLMTKKLNATFIGSGNTLEKHQVGVCVCVCA